MFFYGSPPEPGIRRARNGNWRLVEAHGSAGPIVSVLWESRQRGEVEAILKAKLGFAYPKQRDPGFELEWRGGTAKVDGQSVRALDRNGAAIGSACFAPMTWRTCAVLGAPNGAYTATSISVETDRRGAGAAQAMHDAFAGAYGVPTVPNAAHEVPGILSEDAQGFWAVRALRRDVPGLSGGSVHGALGRSAKLAAVSERWDQEKMHAPAGGPPDRCLAFALAASRLSGLPVIEGVTSRAGVAAYWLEAPGGVAVTSEGVWSPEQGPVLGMDLLPCARRGPLAEKDAAFLAAVWLGGSNGWEPGGVLASDAEGQAARVLVRAGFIPRSAAPPERDFVAEARDAAEARLRCAVPILARAVLDGVAPPMLGAPRGNEPRA